jgi:hypothetical protein
MFKKITAAFAGTVAGLALLFVPSVSATTQATDDCLRVAEADRPLCARVKAQHAYGASFGSGGWTEPNGRVLVHDITHQGYTKAEMRDALKAEALSYRTWVTAVQVNMDAIVDFCGNTDGQWVISFRDADGKPGGVKMTKKRLVCA